jgi:hypothetical protein
MSTPESDLLRQMVRQVLREIVPETMSAAQAATQAPAARTVSIDSDADLASFARLVATASDEERAAIVAGTRTFRLSPGSQGSAATPVPRASEPAGAAVVRIESGPVTERAVRDAAAAKARIVLGRKAVLTPLARDRARAAGVEISREQ